MITLERAFRLLDAGLSLIPVAENKRPTIKWKEYQTSQISKTDFEEHFGNSAYVGICTGYDGLECIDIDLKVFASLSEQQAFWKELLSFLQDNIDDFDDKFCIYKTKNSGYHIIYKSGVAEGNKKLAKLKGHTEAIIETRGVGGYIFVYDNCITKRTYLDIEQISDYDREILWSVCRTYNYQEETAGLVPDKKTEEEYEPAAIKPWVDFNEKNSIFDIIGSDLKIVRTLSDKYIVKRAGATSPHSGYVYKDSGCMYLFSTGTVYPHEKLITPFIAYTYKSHNGDFKSAGAAIYKDGYGTRIVKKVTNIIPDVTINKADLIFPIDIFPKDLQTYILECNSTLDSSIDYMGCSLLWLTSTIVGNCLSVKVKTGWEEIATVWIAVVGKAGIGKTPSIKNITFPLEFINSREIKRFLKQLEKYNHYKDLDKKERENYEEVRQPVKSQFIANDITLEALVDLHQDSKNSVAVFKDELNGWFKDMNKYRAGSDLEFWLSTWSGKSVNLNRLTRKGSFVEKPIIPVLGGIQPSVLSTFYTEENKDNGFVDRMLLSFPDLEIDKYNTRELSEDLIRWYNDSITYFYEDIVKEVVKYDEHGDIITLQAKFSTEAAIEWERIFNDITQVQNSDEENEYMKSMLPKQKSYIPRFALLINTLSCYFNGGDKITEISKDSILKAEQLSKYFVAMAKKIKVNSIESNVIKTVVRDSKKADPKDVFLEMYNNDKKINKKSAAEILGVSRQSIYKWVAEIDKSVN